MPRYHANYRASSSRKSKFIPQATFGAADDAAAAAIATVIDGLSAGQRVSLTKEVFDDRSLSSYPVGSRFTANAQMKDATGRLQRATFRNVTASATVAHLVALLTGVAGPGSGPSVGALSAPPKLVKSGNLVDVIASAAIINKG